MTDAGWHPDPHGRADRRYHDGTRWTEHTADADGTTSVDPVGPDPTPARPVIGPPPPRDGAPSGRLAPPAEPPPDATVQISLADLPPPPPPPPPVEEDDPVRGPSTQRLTPEDVAAATSSSPAKPVSTDHTIQMSAAELAAAASSATAGPPTAEVGHTEPLSPADIAAAAALADGHRAGAPPAPTAPDDRASGPRPPRVSTIGLIGALLGTATGVAALLALPWVTGPGPDLSYLDLRELVDDTGPDLGTALNAFVLTGALFAVGVGGVAAVARAVGRAPARALAAAVAVLGTAGLAVLGFVAVDVDRAPSLSAADVAPEAGTTVTLPDGSPVTDPSTGDPVTVSGGGSDLSEEAIAGAAVVQGEDRLTDAAVLGAGVLVVAGVLTLVGLLLRGVAGHVITALGLLVAAAWSIGAVLAIGGDGFGDVSGTGLGAYALAASTVLLAISAAIPPRRRRHPDAGSAATG